MMRFPHAFAALALAAVLAAPPGAAADEGRPSPAVRLVEVMPDAGQALLRDQKRGEYVVVRVGDRIAGLRVTDIAPDRLVLRADNKESFVLSPLRQTAPEQELMDPYAGASGEPEPQRPRRPEETRPAPEPDGRAAATDHRRDARADAAEAEDARGAAAPSPADIAAGFEGDAGPSRDGGSDGHDSRHDDPDGRSDAGDRAPAATSASRSAGAGADASPDHRPQQRELQRAELEAALGDFDALSRQLKLRFTDGGVEVMSVQEGTFFHRAGLRAGDLIVRVDERPVRSIGDAAVLYGRVELVERFTVELKRGDERLTLRYRLVP